jgi:hypothetical protein
MHTPTLAQLPSSRPVKTPLPAPKTVRLELHVTPPDASLSLDGKAIASGTNELTDVEGAERVLQVSAPGYITRDVKLSFLLSSSVEITLEKARVPHVVVPPRPVIVPRTTSTSSVTVQPKRPSPTNEIDLGY